MTALSVLAEALKRFDPPWMEVGRIFRRICFLRAEGRTDEARRVEETDLAEATVRARAGSESEFESESILQALIADEKERVCDAIAFAEILVPMLAERLAANVSPVRAAAHVAKKASARAAAAPREIADFIDDMIRQDKSA
ncbi:MAG TPA: hypothetical protein VFE25_11750 [Opitutaceae bacterium]|nr:hypothetical protein [Opitutaceae bacterium]